MKAAVCRTFGQPLAIEDVALDEPATGEVRVQVKAVAVCGSDVHAARGSWNYDLPMILGHEASGVITQLGNNVSGLAVGDHVVVSLLRNCGVCFHCRRDESPLCEHPWTLNTDQRIHGPDGEPIHQGIYVGAFAEEVVVHQQQCVVIPGEVPFDSASLLACGVITGHGAVTNTAKVEPGASVVVIGAGGVGLNSIQAAAAVAATTVIALDTAPEKLDVAMQFGATHALQAGDPAVARKVLALTEGRGPDYVFVTVGSARAVEQGLDLVRKAGMLVVVGLGADDTVARIALRDFASGGRRIIGSKMGGADLQRDVRALVASYLRGDLLLDELITDRYALEDINAAIAGVGLGSTLRNVVVFE